MLISALLKLGWWVWDGFETYILTQDQNANETEEEKDKATLLYVYKEESGQLEELVKMPLPLVCSFRIVSFSVTHILRDGYILIVQVMLLPSTRGDGWG